MKTQFLKQISIESRWRICLMSIHHLPLTLNVEICLIILAFPHLSPWQSHSRKLYIRSLSLWVNCQFSASRWYLCLFIDPNQCEDGQWRHTSCCTASFKMNIPFAINPWSLILILYKHTVWGPDWYMHPFTGPVSLISIPLKAWASFRKWLPKGWDLLRHLLSINRTPTWHKTVISYEPELCCSCFEAAMASSLIWLCYREIRSHSTFHLSCKII